MNNFNVGIVQEMNKEAGFDLQMAKGIGVNTAFGALAGGALGGIGNAIINDGSFLDGAGYGALAGGGLAGLGSTLAMIPANKIMNRVTDSMDDLSNIEIDALTKYIQSQNNQAKILAYGGLGAGALGGLGAGLTLGDR